MRPGVLLCLALAFAACGREEAAPPSPPAATAGVLPPGHPPVAGAAPAAAGPAISGSVSCAPALGGCSGAALYIIARSAGSQQIVAVRKQEAPRFPLRFSISGADAMTEGTAFEGPLDLTARLSLAGDAIPAKGDVEGTVRGVMPRANEVAILLDTVRP